MEFNRQKETIEHAKQQAKRPSWTKKKTAKSKKSKPTFHKAPSNLSFVTIARKRTMPISTEAFETN